MAVFFVLLLLIVQIGFLVAARSLAVSAVEASARRLATGVDVEQERARVSTELEASVPGVQVHSITIREGGAAVTLHVELAWTAPGPNLLPITFDLASTRTLAVGP